MRWESLPLGQSLDSKAMSAVVFTQSQTRSGNGKGKRIADACGGGGKASPLKTPEPWKNRPLVICCICAEPIESYVSLAVTTVNHRTCDGLLLQSAGVDEKPPPPRAGVDPDVAAFPLPLRLLGSEPHHRAWLPAARSAIRFPRLRVECARFDLERSGAWWTRALGRLARAPSLPSWILDEGEQREAVLAAWRTFEHEVDIFSSIHSPNILTDVFFV
ncbi:hypothetical protein DFH06DRAFT_1421578 [Mycena polygramma]|nr:hypothetical protein DFH06DRAFT_1421578 [Mycena polygramma]